MFQLIIFILNMNENKRKVIELSLQEITIRSENKFTAAYLVVWCSYYYLGQKGYNSGTCWNKSKESLMEF